MRNPPMLKGGQGRTDDDIEADAMTMARWTIYVALLVAALWWGF